MREYIEHYTSEGDIVLDPFSGSGVTAIEALKAKRKVIATDLDPMSMFIAKMTIDPADLEKFQKVFDELKMKLSSKMDSLYETTCPKCGAHVTSEAIIWNINNPVKIRLSCKCSRNTLWKKPSSFDKKKLSEIQEARLTNWFPRNDLIWNSRINVSKGEKIADLFTKRNLIALSVIFKKISLIKDKKTRELMRFTFTSALGQASKMVFVIKQRGRALGLIENATPQVGSWATRGYWTPPEFFEVNAWNCFEERFNKVFRGKIETNSEITKIAEASSFEELKNNKDYLARTTDVLELDKIVPNESIDYVFTDPPFGDYIPYLELDYLWSSWLGFKADFDSEIIISDSPERKEKNFNMYSKMLSAAFREIFRVLKRGKYFTLTFHNNDIRIFNLIISSTVLAGFDLEKIIYQPPARASPKSLLAPYGSAVGDYYIRYYKPKRKRSLNNEEIDRERYERIVIDTVKHIIAKRGEPTPYSIIVTNYSLIYSKLKENGFLFSAPENVKQILKKQLNKEFILKNKKWWFKDISKVPYIEIIPLNDRVEKIALDVLNRKIKVRFDDILREIFTVFTNSLTPDVRSVGEVLSDLAVHTKDGKWILKPRIKKRLSQHDLIVEMLAKLGELAGYEAYADISGYRTKLSLPSIPPKNVERIQEIDVLWLGSKKIAFEFEVENTTGITEAIVRGSNIPTISTKRYIVIPGERKKEFYRKIAEPMIREKIEKLNWGFILFDELLTFFEHNKKKQILDLKEFSNICQSPCFKTDLPT